MLDENNDVIEHKKFAEQKFNQNNQDTQDNYIKVNHLRKVHGSFPALNDNSFIVKKGEVFGLLGPIGSGKTTMFDIIRQA